MCVCVCVCVYARVSDKIGVILQLSDTVGPVLNARLIIANCKIISISQKLKRKQKFRQSMSRELVLHLSVLFSSQS